VSTLGLRKSFRFVCLFCLAFGVNVAWADEADDLSAAVVAHIRERLPTGAPPVAPDDQNRITAFSRYLPKRFYYPTTFRELQSAAIAAVDSTAAEPATDAPALVQAAINGMVDSLGHGARFLTTLGSDGSAAQGGAASPSVRLAGSLLLVALPTMNVTDGNKAHTCVDFVHFFESKTEGRVSGVVLDLRGNEGGPLTDSACLAGLFLKKNSFLFQVASKQGELVKYESKPITHIDAPVAVLIDNRTDNGGLLVAAVLQDQRRAPVIGELKTNVNGAVSSLVFPPGVNRALVLPTGEVLLPNKQPLASGIHVDVTMPANDEDALLNAARTSLAQAR
jgi:Peptidase family S41